MVDRKSLNRLDLVRSELLQEFATGFRMYHTLVRRKQFEFEERSPLVLCEGHWSVLALR